VLSLAVGIAMVGDIAVHQLGYLIGRSLMAVLVVSLFVWLTTRRRTVSIWILILIALPFYVGFGLIVAAGAAAGGR
jgi:hypothetical protein